MCNSVAHWCVNTRFWIKTEVYATEGQAISGFGYTGNTYCHFWVRSLNGTWWKHCITKSKLYQDVPFLSEHRIILIETSNRFYLEKKVNRYVQYVKKHGISPKSILVFLLFKFISYSPVTCNRRTHTLSEHSCTAFNRGQIKTLHHHHHHHCFIIRVSRYQT